ncbi:transposase [Gottschalkia acidurici 9a]|uniref:Transposase n=1 Tax=Gottschalkia acidurici (strain ATCC 7906 / DSM 604 / BCRC 14475 / CIP 104303 / KCTC 5404 / NCIMB 10678 / 9a) TaxID=1128398 RepID=K0B1A9_GOTA9|nr:RNA-guided endonuclease TnpB family protein [Gottschalkia acidurici]AFS78857.1 transposase [Gottschalkia acidurici 9a]
MIKGLNIRLYPTREQEILMYKHIGSMRFVWNWALNKQIKHYKETNKKLSIVDLGKELTKLKQLKEYTWLYEVSNATLKESIRDLDKAYQRFFKGSGFPKFKSKKKSEPRFYSRYEKIKFTRDVVNLEKIGKVRYRADYNIDLTQIAKFSNPRVKFNGRCWVLTLGIEIEPQKANLNDFSLGIDLDISQLAITNIDELGIKNINKTHRVKKLNKKLKRLQRQCSRKYEMNKEGSRYQKTRNIVKLEKKIKRLHNKLKNIRLNHIYQATNKMVKTKPSRVVMENLNVSGMMKNRHLSKAIAEQGLCTFISQMKYKCKKDGIKFIQAPRFYPSSKTCSKCGTIKKDLKLSDRTYKCECGFICDRDKNASYNLANYGLEKSS